MYPFRTPLATTKPEGRDLLADVPDAAIPARKVEIAAGRQDRTRRFVKGPLTLAWIGAATRAGHPKALPMLLALRFKADAGGEPWVKPPSRVLTEWGFSANDRSRALRALEGAGLVELQRREGRPPLVRPLPWREGANG